MTTAISKNNAANATWGADDTTASNAGATSATPSLMPEPGGTDVGLVVATLVIENAFTSRKLARQDRQDATRKMVTAQDAQIKHMREQAELNHSAAQFDGWGKIAGGVANLSGGIGAGHNALKAPKVGDACSQLGSAMGSVASATGGLLSAGAKSEADHAGAAAKAAEMEAAAHKNSLENADDEIKEAREHTRKALDFLREFNATEAKSMASAIRA